ncbi:MAG TPA: hypothetical protein PKC19_12690 [Roseiflexaceae bacterium]|nr:hypothetical protein [Roseiflexaceae bacterium]
MHIPPAEQQRRLQALESRHAEYDPAEHLLRRYFGAEYNYNWYARNTYAHPTFPSLGYAVDLLDTYDDTWLERAQAIIRRIIGIQEADPAHPHYGVWPHLMEEPLGKGPYVDRNWADFLGKLMIHILLYHRERLPSDLVAAIEESLRRAIEAIRIRNVRPGYTNIAVMSSYVTLIGGEALGDQAIIARGIERLRELIAYTREQEGFTEYNSPTYTMVALRDLATFRHQLRDAEAAAIVAELYRIAWEIVAQHFHPPTRQWVGPSSRNYAVFLETEHLRFIERWTSARVDFGLGEVPGDPALAGMDARCPADLEPLLTTLATPRTVVQTVLKREQLPLIATTYLAPEFALGSINHQDTWNQRRNIIAFWGDHAAPAYCRVRLLYDGYDLAAGALFVRQEQNCLLGVVAFATDGGGRHISLDLLPEGVFAAEELCVRFEFGGAAAGCALPLPERLDAPIALRCGELPIGIHVPFATFDGCAIGWESGRAPVEREAEAAFLDLVIYRGARRAFRLPDVQRAAIAFAMYVGAPPPAPPAVAVADGTMLRAAWRGMQISAPLRPAPYAALRDAAG